MSEDPLSEIGFDGYFSLLRQVIPRRLDFYICSLTGEVLAADMANATPVPHTRIKTATASRHTAPESRSRLVVDKTDGSAVYLMDIRTPADLIAGLLVAVEAAGCECRDDDGDADVASAFSAIADCIEREYRLTAELNTMAQELTGRYEELNLVYDAVDSTSIEQEGITLKQLVESYVAYLDVDMVALIYPDKKRVLFANSEHDPIPEPYELIRHLSSEFLPIAMAQGQCLLINDIIDPRRDEFSLDVPYKILTCPVINTRGGVDGALICLNHTYRLDFFNSDRNLLKVMARKVAKITQSNYDALTGLMNQHAFETVLQRAVHEAESEGTFHSVLNIDIGQLQVLNETHGRDAGDQMIRSVGELLRGKLRGTDAIGYLGEGRYGILLENCRTEQGMGVARTLRDHVERFRVGWNSTQLELQVAIGVTVVEPHTTDVGEVMEAAELARIAAKELGQGQIQVYRQDDTELVDRRRHMKCVSLIQKALREDRFRLYCQTIQPAVGNGERYHFEVLIRLIDEEGLVVGPDKFIPAAEQFNLMPSIDRWVVDATLASLSAAGIAGSPGEGIVAINLSGQSLTDFKFADYVADRIRQYNIASSCLCFEVTETAAIGNREAALAIIENLKAIGCHFSLDDFGTGLSSFSYLKELPVDFVKIDGSFVRQILEDQVSHAMVASIIQIGHVMGLKTIAEYVENNAIAERLVHMDVDYLQGYGIDRPQPLADYLSALCNMKSLQAG